MDKHRIMLSDAFNDDPDRRNKDDLQTVMSWNLELMASELSAANFPLQNVFQMPCVMILAVVV